METCGGARSCRVVEEECEVMALEDLYETTHPLVDSKCFVRR
jgi:hypothetical protein